VASRTGKKKKGAPKSILVRFRNLFPQLRKIESKNQLKVNLVFAITLIEKLRHIIVHNGGETSDKTRFIQCVAKDAGMLNNGNINKENTELVNQFFGEGEYENLVALLEIPVDPEEELPRDHCRFGILANILMSYSNLLHQMVSDHVISTKA
jgi:hypothetical protein